METIDLGFRFGGATVMALVAALMIREYGRTHVGQLGVLFIYCAISYMFCPRIESIGAGVALLPLFYIGCFTIPFSFWLFVRAIFDDSFRVKAWHGGVFLLFIIVGFTISFLHNSEVRGRITATLSPAYILFFIKQFLALGFALHALVLTGLGLKGDLIEKRRKVRLYFVTIVGAYISLVIIVEIFLTPVTVPLSLEAFNAGMIWLMTFGLAVLMLDFRPDSIFSKARPIAPPLSELSADDQRTIDALLHHIEQESGYKKEGLTISQLADTLNVPVHRLRHLINAQLGFRNFSEFINSYRIAEACRILADSEKSRLPVLTIALNLGFGSIGPFNRAFKSQVGQTPTQYRQAALSSQDRHTS